MPVYDYKCKCGAEKIDEFVTGVDKVVTCDDCSKTMKRQFPLRFTVDQFPKGGIFLKHVCPEGKRFHSKTEMKRYARENNLELGALL